MNDERDYGVPTPILVDGWPAWLRPDGTVMHVIAGGAPDGDDGADGGGEDGGSSDDGADGADDGPGDPAAEAAKWKALARKHEGDAKKYKGSHEELEKLRESQKTEEQKRAEAQAAAEKRAEEAEQRALRLEVAAEKGLTPAQAKRLVGTTKEEIEADADDLLQSFKSEEDDDSGPSRRRPRERMRSTRSSAEPEKSAREIAAAIPRSRY
jgi:hypothetical protein